MTAVDLLNKIFTFISYVSRVHYRCR